MEGDPKRRAVTRGGWARPLCFLGGHADDGLVEAEGPGGAVEAGVTEVEDPTVGGHQPVAVARGGGGHGSDGLVQRDGPGGAVEGGVTEVEDPTVGGSQPVAVGREGPGADGVDPGVGRRRGGRSRQGGGQRGGGGPGGRRRGGSGARRRGRVRGRG